MNELALRTQQRLHALGFYSGGLDGDFGNQSLAAVNAALDRLAGFATAPGGGGIPIMPPAVPKTDGVAATINTQPRASRPINEIIVHCTATPEGRAVTVDEIRAWHKGQGWKDIGYHWVVYLDGSLKPGRPEAQVGSHVLNHNQGTLGIVYVGGVDADGKTPKDTRTPAQKATLMAAVKALIAKYPTVKKVTGHNQYAPKACPSFDVRKDPLGHLV